MTKNRSFTIRDFQSADAAALKSLIHRTIATCYPGHYCAEAVRFFLNYHDEEAICRDASEGCTVILERAGKIVGTGMLVADEIKRVFVEPAAQGLGMGRRIMQYLEDRARSSGVATVKLDASLPAKAFYDRLGYATVEKTSRPVENGRGLDFFKMQKVLTTVSR